MVIKVYTSGISGNKEVKKRQQRIMMILDSKGIGYEAIDITEPGKEADKHFMQDNAKAKDSKHPLPPQIFNEDDYCGDYEGFDLANENDVLEVFLKLPLPPTPVIKPPPVINGRAEHTDEKDTDGITPDIERNEEIINIMVPNSVDSEKAEEVEEEPVEEIEVLMEEPEEVVVEKVEEVVEEVEEEVVVDKEEEVVIEKEEEEVIVEKMEEEVEESVHGFCYTPSLAKRIEKALRARIKSSHSKSVHGFCYTPSLASRLTKALERAFLRKKSKGKKKEDINSKDIISMDEDKEETESEVNNVEEMNYKNEKETAGTKEEEEE